jgi:hypothetical protein
VGEKTFVGVTTGIASSHPLAEPSLDQLLNIADATCTGTSGCGHADRKASAAPPQSELRVQIR